VRIDWGEIPDPDAGEYPYTISHLRIYAQLIGIDVTPRLVKEVTKDDADWVTGYFDFTTETSLDAISSIITIEHFIPKCKWLGIFLDRLLLCDGFSIFYSVKGTAHNFFNIQNFVDFRFGSKNEAKNCGIISDRCYIYKEGDIYCIVGDIATPTATLHISEKYGLLAPDSLVVWKSSQLFISRAGLCLLYNDIVTEISSGVINKWLFDTFTIEEISRGFSTFDINKKEYRFHIKGFILVFDFSNEFWIEDKLLSPQEYTSATIILDRENNEQHLFGNSNKYLYRDKVGVAYDGRDRNCYLLSKEYKLNQFEDKMIPSLFRLNAILNRAAVIYNERDAQMLTPGKSNFYMLKLRDFADDTFQFAFIEESPHECEIMDMGFEFA
jgi:hypothetical protein